MSQNITGEIQQYNIYNIYNTPCSSGDWNYASSSCSKVDPFTCPLIGGYWGTSAFSPGANLTATQAVGVPVTCSYDIGSIQTIDDVMTWIDYFGKDDTYNNEIMPYFCFLPAEPDTCRTFEYVVGDTPTCPSGLTGCSNMSSLGDTGQLCSQWALGNTGSYFSSGSAYCSQYVCSNDCLCYNRGLTDPLYISLNQQTTMGVPSGAAFCWYVPCQTIPPYLLPANQTGIGQTCPNVCQSVLNIFDNTNTNINVEEYTPIISCSESGGSTGSFTPQSFWDNYKWWIIIGLSVFLTFSLIIVIILIYYVSYKTKSK